MSALVDWTDVGKIFVESLAAGVVIVGIFAAGARFVATASGRRVESRSTAGPTALAVFCFLVVAAAIGYGIYFTIDK